MSIIFAVHIFLIISVLVWIATLISYGFFYFFTNGMGKLDASYFIPIFLAIGVVVVLFLDLIFLPNK